MGFYPVAPGSGQYSLGIPAITQATIKLENGKTFTVEAKNQSDQNVYVQKAEQNGKPLSRLFITHEEIAAGGKLIFYMTPKARK